MTKREKLAVVTRAARAIKPLLGGIPEEEREGLVDFLRAKIADSRITAADLRAHLWPAKAEVRPAE